MWRGAFCPISMGVDVPLDSVTAVLQEQGSAVGDYVGDRQAELSTQPQPPSIYFDVVDAEVGLDDQPLDNYDEESSDSAHPLLIFYDCGTTGSSIYDDHITDIAAQVVDSPVPLEIPAFSSHVKTSRRIPNAGIVYERINDIVYVYIFFL